MCGTNKTELSQLISLPHCQLAILGSGEYLVPKDNISLLTCPWRSVTHASTKVSNTALNYIHGNVDSVLL